MTVYRTDDDEKWGTGKGSALTSAEGDNNMWGFDQRIKDIEDNPPAAVSVSNIVVSGATVKFFLNDGSSFGPFDLPVASFNFRGDWLNSQVYAQLDLVTVPHRGLYVVLHSHMTADSPTAFDPDAVNDDGDALYGLLFGEDTYIYDFGFFYPGKPGLGISDDDVMAGHLLQRPVSLPIDCAGSGAKLITAPTSDLSFVMLKNGVSIGTLDFAASALSGTFTLDTATSFAVGDIFALQRPETIDATARNLVVTFVATRLDFDADEVS